jgi:hypothetical protein
MKKIVLGKEVYDQIMYYVKKTNFEISGLGAVEIIDKIPTVTKIYLLDQENSHAETEMSGESIAKLMYEHEISGHPGALKFWWHSHVNMGVFWSGTDTRTMDELTKYGWFIHGVFNKKNEYKLAYTTNEPFELTIDDIEMEIDYALVSPQMLELYKQQTELSKQLEATYDEFYKTHVKERTYTYPSANYNKKNKEYNRYDDWPSYYADSIIDATRFNDNTKSDESEVDAKLDEDEKYIASEWDLASAGWNDEEIAEFYSNGVYTISDAIAFEEKMLKSGKDYFWNRRK